jgi:Tol biopolymer transport system component
MVSHFDWRDDKTILAWSRTREEGDHFYLFDVDSNKTTVVGEGILTRDGHCSYSPDRKWILNDTYPDQSRMQTLMLYSPTDGKRIDIGRFYLPSELKGPFRCDLHPRWNRDGTKVCVDSAHSGKRQLYTLDVGHITQA